MPIEGISQPGYLEVNGELRFRAYDGRFEFAFDWYQGIGEYKKGEQDGMSEAL